MIDSGHDINHVGKHAEEVVCILKEKDGARYKVEHLYRSVAGPPKKGLWIYFVFFVSTDSGRNLRETAKHSNHYMKVTFSGRLRVIPGVDTGK